MKQLIFIFIVTILSFSTQAANECKLRYKTNGSAFKTETINKGSSKNLTRSNFTEAYNIGRNDMKLTLEYFDVFTQRNKTETLNLLKVGNKTVSLPIIPLINKKLKRIQCKNYSTVADAQKYIRQFGTSANTLVTNATNQATAAVTSAASAAVNTFSSQTANALKSSAQTAINQLNNQYNQAKNAAKNNTSKIQTNLSARFPEVKTAVNATQSYSWKLSDAVMTQGEQNIQNTLANLNRIDKKYKVSQTASNLTKVNLSKDFPELNQLVNQQCDLANPVFKRFNSDFSKIQKQINQLDKKYALSKNAGKLSVALVKVPRVDIAKITRFNQFKQCSKDWTKFTKGIEGDVKIYAAYSKTLIKELKKIDKRILTASQQQFIKEVSKLLKASDVLNKEQKRQKSRKSNMYVAQKAHQAALNKVENDVGPMGDYLEKLPAGELLVEPLAYLKNQLPDWMTRDPKRLKANLADARKKGLAYEKAVNDYDSGFDKIQTKYNLWNKQIGTTLKVGTRLKVKLPNGSPLWKILQSVPRYKSLSNGFTTLISCTLESIKITTEAFKVFDNALNQYVNNIDRILNSVLPKDVKRALIEVQTAIKQVNDAGIPKYLIPNPDATFLAIKKDVNKLNTLIKNIAKGPNIVNQFNTALSALQRSGKKRQGSIGAFKTNITKLTKSIVNLANKSAALGNVLKKHAKSKEMQQLVSAIDSTMGTGWTGVKTSMTKSVSCISDSVRNTGTVASTISTRIKSFLKNKSQVAGAALPAPIKNSLKALIADLNQLDNKYQQFSVAVGSATSAYGQMAQSRNQAVAALVPVLKSNAPQKVQQVIDKMTILKQKLAALNNKSTALSNSERKFVADLTTFASELIKLSGKLASEANSLAYSAFDTSVVSKQINGANNVLNKWLIAGQKLPERVASLATGGLSDQVKSQIESGIAQMNSLNSSLLQCVSNASNKRNELLSQQRRTQAINQTVAGLSADATATIVSLQALLRPSLNILSKVNAAINKAIRLSDRIQSIATTATNNFVQNASNIQRDFNSAKQCVTSKKGQILSKKSQLSQLLN